MSLLASFYLVPTARSEELIAAAKAQTAALTKKRWGLFKPKLPLNPDPLWEFLRTNTQELEEFPYRGSLLLDVEILATGALSSEHPLGLRLSEITGSTFISYAPSQATEVIQIIGQTDLSDQAIEAYLHSEGRSNDIPEFVEPIQHASQRLVRWLQAVTDENIGLLTVG